MSNYDYKYCFSLRESDIYVDRYQLISLQKYKVVNLYFILVFFISLARLKYNLDLLHLNIYRNFLYFQVLYH